MFLPIHLLKALCITKLNMHPPPPPLAQTTKWSGYVSLKLVLKDF